MENKINIAELLKDCPKGMELDCTMFENVSFVGIKNGPFQIMIQTPDGAKYLNAFGCYHNSYCAKCVIFPKGKTTWEGFVPPVQFKDGDIVSTSEGRHTFILKGKAIKKESYYTGNVYFGYHAGIDYIMNNDMAWYFNRLATEEEKQKLFEAIKANGYKWNDETKTLEKLTELTESKEEVDEIIMSKEDRHDEIVMAGIYFDREYYADEVELHLGNYEIEIRDGKTYAVFKNQETKTLKPKFKVGDKIKHINGKNKNGVKEGIILSITCDTYDVAVTNDMGIFIPIADQYDWELVPNKFDISTLKPFESRVLCRDVNDAEWTPTIWGYYSNKDRDYKYKTIGAIYRYCIPYEGNEHLLGKTDDCDDFYKTWE